MSFSYIYLTRRALFLNYRDYMAVGLISMYGVTKFIQRVNHQNDECITQRVYTNDESDTRYKEVTNKRDGAVKREHAMKYAERIKAMRAANERAM